MTVKVKALLLLMLLAVTAVVFAPVRAISQQEGILNRLLTPGPLIKGHENLENNCTACHDVGKGISVQKCLDCHKEINHYVAAKHGFHGMQTESCIACHSDHKGRDYDSVAVNEKEFDHKETGFPLEGKHANIKCSECHKAKRVKKFVRPRDTEYFGTGATCVKCHRRDDVHFFKGKWAKKDCNACHGVKTWKTDIKFDHNRDTKYKLEGAHAKLKCAECHVPKKIRRNARYQWPRLKRDQCLSCHTNFHKNNLSSKFNNGKCDTCHNIDSWKIEKFDHDVTNYPLREKHGEIKCEDCHKQTPETLAKGQKYFHWAGLKTACLSCHKDYHRFGPFHSATFKHPNQCLECHDERDWKKPHNWDHNAQTRYPIDGKHVDVSCNACHVPKTLRPNQPGIYHWAKLETKTCENCHKNPHVGTFSKKLLQKRCTECHVTQGWNIIGKGGAFDHSKTRFPLVEKHAKLSCKECHVVNKHEVYKFTTADVKFCVSCHNNVHVGQFSAKLTTQSCAACHNQTKFSELLPFDHDTKTNYPLKGEHAKLKCGDCHKPTGEMLATKPPRPKDKFLFPEMAQKQCRTCHEDYHKGQLPNCARCHSEKGWKTVAFNHDLDSKYPLEGKHATLKCSECHKAIKDQKVEFNKKVFPVTLYKPMPTDCAGCHKDPHKGGFGNKCAECHTPRDWHVTQDFHKNFTLSGVHFTLTCNECHKDNRRLAGLSGKCVMCHQKDDIHNGTLPNCGECHRQQVWEISMGFQHSLTRFPLRGAHRTLDCIDCHNRGIYQGTPTQCISCHLADVQGANNPPHQPLSSFTNCTDCHKNEFSWLTAAP